MWGVKNTYKENSDGGNWSTQIISKNGGEKTPQWEDQIVRLR